MRLFSTLGWACYLGASWTWVIGMLLPILLVRDYGAMGWVAFAVPNVLGAMMMGLVLSRRRSEAIVAGHAAACVAFSRVTMAFQLIVLPWALMSLLDWQASGAVWVSLVVLTAVAAISYRLPIPAAAGVTILSAGAFAWFTMHEGAWLTVAADGAIQPRLQRGDLLAFMPAAAFGFALCPYLDLTFHEARQRAGPAAFVIGFGVVFFTMILFSLAYALPLCDGLFPLDSPRVRLVLGLHVILQCAFTVAAHLRQVVRVESAAPHRAALGLPLFFALGWLLVARYPQRVEPIGMSAAEMLYRTLLLLYATVFPVYVLSAMIPTRRNVTARWKRRAALVGGAASLPPAAMVFVTGYEPMILPVILILAATRLAASCGPVGRTVAAGG